MMTQTVTHVEDLFDSLDRERAGEERAVRVSKELPSVVEQLLQRFQYGDFEVPDEPIRARDISLLSMLLPEYEENKGFFPSFAHHSGDYLNKCINHCVDEEITIITENYKNPPRGLFRNNASMKHVIVRGDLGEGAGSHMRNGAITVYGSTGNYTGLLLQHGKIIVHNFTGNQTGNYMSGGEIIIAGNVGLSTGQNMREGIIDIRGDVGGVGTQMYGGEIRIGGTYGFIPKRTNGGDIYHKGKQIVKDGERV